jgi:hypothetical protein
VLARFVCLLIGYAAGSRDGGNVAISIFSHSDQLFADLVRFWWHRIAE